MKMKRTRQVQNVRGTANPTNSISNVYKNHTNRSFRVTLPNENSGFIDTPTLRTKYADSQTPASPSSSFVGTAWDVQNPSLSYTCLYPETYWAKGQPVPPHLPAVPLGSLTQVAALISNMGTSGLDISRLSTTLVELIHQCLDIASLIDIGLVIDLENRHGSDLVRNGLNTLYDRLQARRSKTDVDMMKSVAFEVVWHVENFNKIASHRCLIAQDLTAGHFTAPNSVVALIDDTFTFIRMEDFKDGAQTVMKARRALQKRLRDMYNLRVKRGITDRDGTVRNIMSVTSILTETVGRKQVNEITKMITSTSMSQRTKEAIVLAAAGRIGAKIEGGMQMRDTLRLISRGARASIILVTYGITPQDLWDYLLPYVTVVDGVLYRGLIGGEIWLRSGDDNGSVHGRERRFVAVEEIFEWSSNASVVRAGYHPTIFSISSNNFQNLLWWTSLANPVTQKLYKNLLECASTGSSPTGKSASDLWRSAVRDVVSFYPDFAKEIVLGSLTLRSVSAIAIASASFETFCDALYTRVVALLSSEESKIEERTCMLELSRDANGAVLVRQTGGRPSFDSRLPDLARRIQEYCGQDGLIVVHGFQGENSYRESPPDFALGEIWTPSIARRWGKRTWRISSLNDRERNGIG